MKIDITLRDILQTLPKKFIEILTGKKGKKLLDTSLPNVKDRRVDLLVELEDGTIFHLELQSSNQANMEYRMLEYWTLLKMKYPARDIIQMLLYVGDKKLTMSNNINLKNLKFNYILKDIRDINCEELLKSENIEDKILSILCKVENEEELLLKLLNEIYRLEATKRKDTLLKILTLSRLRVKVNKILEKAVKEKKMPITIELEKDPYYLQGMKKGIEKGIEKGIQKGIQKGIEEGIEKGIEEGLKLSIQRMYKELDLSMEDISKILKVPVEKVKEAVKEDRDKEK